MDLPTTSGAFVVTSLCACAAAALVLKPREAAGRRKKAIFCALLLPAIGLRLFTACLGHNYDMYSWAIVSDFMRHGQSFYAGTDRYNYGPVWAYVLRALDLVSGDKSYSDVTALHVSITAFLSLVDAVIACLLMRSYGLVPACLYLFCPISILTSGYHGQFDNFAILLALLSWRLIQRRRVLSGTWIAAAAGLMGLSLAVKHIFFLFPLWLVFAGQWRRRKDALIFVGISYALFCVSFLPWVFDPASRAGIMANVFRYRSTEEDSLLRYLVSLVAPWTVANASFWWSPAFNGAQSVFVLAVLGMMLPVSYFRKSAFHYYLLGVVIFSPALAEQYLVIPLISCCVFYGSVSLGIYLGLASFILLFSPYVLGALPAFAGLRAFAVVHPLDCHHAVFWLFVFVVARGAVWLRRAALARSFGSVAQPLRSANTFVATIANQWFARKWLRTGALLAGIAILVVNVVTYPPYFLNRATIRGSVLQQIAEENCAVAMDYLGKGNNQAAVDSINRALSIHAYSAGVLATAGRVFLTAGDRDKGFALLRQALSCAENQQVPRNLGWFCYNRRDYQVAAECFKRALYFAPADPAILNDLGACYMALGLGQQADALFQRALVIDPSSAVAKRNVELLRRSSKGEKPP